MGSPFDAAARAADAVQARVFGEPVRIEPQTTHIRYGSSGADGTRSVRTVTGVFTKAPESSPLEGARRGGDPRGSTNFAGFDAKLWLSAEVHASLGYELRDGDIIVLTGRASERWVVTSPGPATDVGDITVGLTTPGDAT